jgi:transposase-like protein
METAQYVTNPVTGRQIQVGGPTYRRLRSQGHQFARAKTKAVPTSHGDRRYSDSELAQIMQLGKSGPVTLEAVAKTMGPGQRAKRQSVQEFMRKGHQYVGQGPSLTAGWYALAPQRGAQRDEVLERCGAKCFLRPPESYPICAKIMNSPNDCKINCAGVESAKRRAGQWHAYGIENAASKIYNRLCEEQD